MKEENNLLTFPYFRPLGALPEFSDDPLADLLNEFKEMEIEREGEIDNSTSKATSKTLGKSNPGEVAPSAGSNPMEQLSEVLHQLNQQLQELDLAQRRIHFYIEEIEANLPED